MQKHLLDDMTDVTRPLMDEFNGTGAVAGGTAATGTEVGAAANGARARLLDGAEPPFDVEAT